MQPESEENGQKVDVGNTRFVLNKLLFNFHFEIKSHFDVEFSGGKISVPRQDANVSYEIKNGQPVFSLRRSPRKLAPHLVKHFLKANMAVLLYETVLFSYGLCQKIQSSQAAHPPLDKTSSLSFPPRPTPPCLNTSSYSRETFGSAKTFSTPCFKQSWN